MPLIIIIFFTVVISYLVWFFFDESRKSKTLPPGPPVLPFIGSIVSIALVHKEPHLAFVKLAEKYGDITRLRMGPYEHVLVSSYEALNDLFTRDEALGRIDHGPLMDRCEVHNTGIAFSNGESWRIKRNWMVKTLKEFGIGRTSYFENTTRSMLANLHANLRDELKTSGNVTTVDRKTGLFTASMMWNLLVGFGTPEEVKDCEKFLHATDLWFQGASYGDGILLVAPFLKHIFPGFLNYTNTMNLVEISRNLAQKLYNKLSKLNDKSPQNFFHAYILELKKGREHFSEVDFRMTFMDTMMASVETFAAFLEFTFLFLTLNPQKQESLYQEISKKFPKDHVFTMADLKQLPYTQAFMKEVHRLGIIGTNLIPRTLTSDITFRNFTLKKGTTLIENPHVIFKSPIHFGPDPEAFRPERFIDPKDPSKLTGLRKIVTPFSIGKRACPGESIVEIVSFLMLVSTVRNFKLSPVKGEAPPSLKFTVGYTSRPQQFRVHVSPRP